MAQFTFDADGKRVKSVMGVDTILYVGAHYEIKNSSEITKYYLAGTQRVAMRKYTIPQNMSVEYLLSDQLGSASLTTDTNGAKVLELRYKAWGEVRATWTSAPSTTPAYRSPLYTFTGQASDSYINLLWYGSRHYDPASGQRIAMRTPNNNVSFLLSDHLGSTSLTVDSAGYVTSEMRYTPWGDTRYTNGNSPTNYRFTGQRQEASFGLYFYNARWYDSSLGRFAQADTVIPGGVQGYDRYAYVSNNPIKLSDPSGHKCVGNAAECLNNDGNKGGGFTGGDTQPNPNFGCGGKMPQSCSGHKISEVENFIAYCEASYFSAPGCRPTTEPESEAHSGNLPPDILIYWQKFGSYSWLAIQTYR